MQIKMDASSNHIGQLVHNIIDPSIAYGNTQSGCFTKFIDNCGMQRKDMFGQKCIIYCTFSMDLIGFSISQ